jgi:hypothetical protein
MAKRYYYTCPFVAAYMAKHHGFQLYIGDFENDDYDAYGPQIPQHIVDDWVYRNMDSNPLIPVTKIHVHPASIPRLDAESGDMIQLCNGSEAYRVNLPTALTDGERIILREDQPFHTPEIEG